MATSIDIIYSDKFFVGFCYQLTKCHELKYDLLQHCAIVIHHQLTQGNSIENIHAYFKRVALLECSPNNRHTNSFNYIYLREKYSELKDIQEPATEYIPDQQAQIIQEQIQKEPTNKKELVCTEIFKSFIELGSARKVSARTGIDFNLVLKIVRHYKIKIKTQYHEHLLATT